MAHHSTSSFHVPMDWENYATHNSYREIPVTFTHQTKRTVWMLTGIKCEKMLVHSEDLKLMSTFRRISTEFTRTPVLQLNITVCDPSDAKTITEIQVLYDGLEKDVVSTELEIPMEKMKEAGSLVQSQESCLYAKVFLDEVLNKIRIHAKQSSGLQIMKKHLSSALKLDDSKISDEKFVGNGSSVVSSKAFLSTRNQGSEIPVHNAFKISEKLCVHVYKNDLLTVQADVIVNAANEDLQHAGGLANLIAQQAGMPLIDDSKKITKRGPLKVTDVVQTTSGNLNSRFRAVLHAVGPRWKDYRSKRKCLEDLKKTVKNVLKISDVSKYTSVAIPSISAGLFGVPKGLCGEMYALAVHEFSKENESTAFSLVLREIHFVDVDVVMLAEIKAGFEKLKAGTLFQPIEKRHPNIMWEEFSNNSKGSTTGFQSSYSSKNKGDNKTSLGTSQRPNSAAITRVSTPSKGGSHVTKISKETMAGIPITVLHFKSGLEVKIYTGSIVRFHGDAIIISADEYVSGTGALGEAVKNAGGRKYEKEFQDMKRQSHTLHSTGDILICKGGELKAHHVMHVVLNQLYDTRQPKLNEYTTVVTKAMEKVHAQGWKKVAMPLIGAGYIESTQKDLQRCCSSLFKVVSDFCFHKEHTCHVKELHFINRNAKVTSSLIDTFKANCDATDFDSKSKDFDQQPKANNSRRARPVSAVGYGGHHSSLSSGDEKANFDKSTTAKRHVAGLSNSFRHSASGIGHKPHNSDEGHPSRSSAAFEKYGARPKEFLQRSHSTPQATSAEKDFDVEAFFQTNQSAAEKSSTMKSSGNLKIIDSGSEDSAEEDVYETVSSFMDKPLKSKGEEESVPCVICLSDITNGMKLDCGHEFCKECLQQSFQQHKQACPVCGTIYGIVKGNQPINGTMQVKTDKYLSLPGYEGYGTITIKYYFPNGTQGPEHPNPGQPYEGTERRGFLPDNEEGRKVLRLLQKAFDRRLTFTIGHSRTTGKDNIVTWNDIHHKTKRDTGAQRFGYPDPTYLQRVQEELAAKGVTE